MTGRRFAPLLAAIAVAASSAAPAVRAADLSTSRLLGSGSGPIEIQSTSLELDNARRVLKYIGEVQAVQGTSVLRCQTLTLHYTETREIEKGACEGDVRFQQGERSASADAAFLERGADMIRLEGTVSIWEAGQEIQGERAKIYLGSERVVIEGSDRRPVRTKVEPRAPSARATPPADDPVAGAGAGLARALAGRGPMPTFDAPIEVKAYWFEAEQPTQEGLYQGGVVTRSGEMVMDSDELALGFDAGASSLAWVEARAEVRIVKGALVATGDRARYSADTGELVLEGAPATFQRGEDHVECERMVFDQLEDKLKCPSTFGKRSVIELLPDGRSDGRSRQVKPGQLFKPDTRSRRL